MSKKLLLLVCFFLLFISLIGCDFFKPAQSQNSTENTTENVTTVSTDTDGIITTVTDNIQKTIPVYQGMVITTEITTQKLSYTRNETNIDINQEDPFNNFDGETIEDEINNLVALPTAARVDYNVNTNQVFYITVKVYNPDQFEILSFTLNGVKYQSYQFQDGSDSENLILKLDPITNSGLIEYTIDQIKYIDKVEIKDAIIEGNQTVRVAAEYQEVPVSLITDKVISPHGMTFNLNIGDPQDLVEKSSGFLKLFLYDGRDIILEQDLSLGINQISFDELYHNTIYQYAVVAVYDAFDGIGPKLVYLEKEAFMTLNYISLTNFDITQDSVSFTITNNDPSATGFIAEISLYQGETFIEELTNYDVLKFNNLLSNVNYSIKFRFTYDLQDGDGEKEEVNVYNITTLSKAIPEVSLVSIAPTQTEVAFALETIDIDNVLMVISIELYHKETLVETINDLENLKFSNLLSYNDYQLRINYQYDLTDGNGLISAYVEYAFLTNNKNAPTISIKATNSTNDTISYIFSKTDMDNVGYLKTVELYDPSNNLVSAISSNEEGIFTGLSPDTNYTLKAIYEYDLNDGVGLRELSTITSIYTADHMTVLSTEVINTNKLTEGDTLVLEITVLNTSETRFTRVKINGSYYKVSDVTTNNFIRVEMVIDDSYTGGSTEFLVEAIEGYSRGILREFIVSENNYGSAFINGDILVDGLTIVDSQGNDLDFVMPGDIFYIKLNFINPSEYNIDALNIDGIGSVDSDSFTVSNNNSTVMIQQSSQSYNSVKWYSLRNFTYSSDSVGTKTKFVEGVYNSIVAVRNTDYRDISTIDDLRNMQSGYAYRLVNDLDFTDVDWIPFNLEYAVLDGNGYSISNLKNVKTYVDTSVNYGLFKYVNYSTIKNLNIVNSLIMITVNNSATSSEYFSCVGILAASSYFSTFKNISIQGEISLDNSTTNYNFIGGLVGQANNSAFHQIYVTAIVSGDGIVGGLIGQVNGKTIIQTTYTTGKIFGDSIGGVVGEGYDFSLLNVYSTSQIHSTEGSNIGGLVGYGSQVLIKNVYSDNTFFSLNGQGYLYFAGIAGNIYDSTVINAFSFATDEFGNYVVALKDFLETTENVYSLVEEDSAILKSKAEILEIMMEIWDLELWSFSDDFVKLKWIPTVSITDIIVTETSISFDIAATDFDQVGEIFSVEIYKEGVLINSLTDFSILYFDLLRYNTEYQIKVVYVYNYGDSVGDQFIEITRYIYTKTKEGTPTIDIIDVFASQEEVTFDIVVNDIDLIGSIQSIKLFDTEDNEIDSLSDFNNFTFSNLLSNKSYLIKVTYGYDFNDGLGYQEFVFQNSFTTISKQIPQISFSDVRAGEFVINFELAVNDPDQVASLYNVEIYQSEILIETLTDFSYLGFDELLSNTQYTIKVSYIYDLNDGSGSHLLSLETSYKTAPHVSLVSMDIVNTEALIVGDTLVLDVVLENPDNIVFTKMLINGIYYDIDIVSKTALQTSFAIEETFGGGMTTVNLEAIKGYLGNDEYTYEFTENNSDSIFINGEIKVESISIVNELGEEVDYVTKGQEFFVKIKFYNPTGYDIESVTTSSGIFTPNEFQINDEKTLIIITSSTYNNSYLRINVSGYTYSNDTISTKTRQVSGIYDSIAVLIDDNIREISTVTDLQNMQSGYYYKLMSDIDLKGITWEPKNFYGIFDGNNHVIYNMTIIKTYQDQDVSIGLFGEVNGGQIKDLFILDFNINITLNSSTTNNYRVRLGSLASTVYNAEIKGIVVNGKLQVQNNSNSYYWYNRMGGLVGYTYDSIFSQVQTNGTLISNIGYNGGLIGEGERIIISNSFSNMTLSKPLSTISYFQGGLIGRLYNSTIENSYTNQMVSGSSAMGIANIIENGVVLNTYTISRYLTTTGTINYVNDSLFLSNYEAILEMQSNWSTDVWSFNGDNPVLKFIPNVTLNVVSISETDVEFSVTTTDFYNVGSILSIEIYQDEVLIEKLTDNSIRTFTGLRYNTEHTIKVVYQYDYSDGTGVQTVVTYLTIVTLPKTGSPEVEIIDVVPYDTYIEFDITSTDPLSVGQISQINIYDSLGDLVDSLTDLNVRTFSDLDPYDDYVLEVLYEYDFGDGYGLQYIKDIYEVRTNPYFVLNSVAILNTEALILGDTLVLQLNVDNPNEVIFTEIDINGVVYPVASTSTTKLRIDIEVTETLGMADTLLNINNLGGVLNGEILTFNLIDNNMISIFINGNISILSVMPVNDNGNEIEYLKVNSPYYIEVLFDNPTGYAIEEITIQGVTYDSSQFTLNNDNTIATISMQLSGSYNQYNSFDIIDVNSFIYSNERVLPKTRLVGGISCTIILLQEDVIRYVSTVEDLKAMENGYIYYLSNDIDMSGIPFEPLKEFSGVFDGQGYTISNLSLIKNYEDVSPIIGLFSIARSAIIKNLNITDINYIITVKSAVNSDLYSYTGGLAGQVLDWSIIENVSVSGNIVINNQTNGSSYTGGIVGFASRSLWENISASINIEFSGNNNYSPVGGIVGTLSESSMSVAYAEGLISGKYNVGGIVGSLESSNISNVYSIDFVISGLKYVGGVAGRTSRSSINDSYSISILSNNIEYQGGIIGYAGNVSVITNAYSYSTYNGNLYQSFEYVESDCTYINIYSPKIDGYSQVTTLENMQLSMLALWDQSIWDFTNTDPYGNPTLK